MSNLSQEEIDRLNHRAFGVLEGFSAEWKEPLVNLLRSSAPIRLAVRELLADAIEGTHAKGIALVMSGHDAQAKRLEGMMVRRAWLKEGLKVFPFIEREKNTADAFAEATDSFGMDDSHWRKRYYYAKNFIMWKESSKEQSKFYAILDAIEMEDIWHLASYDQKKDIKPQPLSGPEYDEMMRARIGFLNSIKNDRERPYTGYAAEVFIPAMLAYFRFLPPEKPKSRVSRRIKTGRP